MTRLLPFAVPRALRPRGFRVSVQPLGEVHQPDNERQGQDDELQPHECTNTHGAGDDFASPSRQNAPLPLKFCRWKDFANQCFTA